MVLEDLYKRLSLGELSNLASSGGGSGAIKEDKQEQVVQHINDGLLVLHTKFLLKQKDANIKLEEHITRYFLNSNYAQSNTASTEPYKYILDSAEDPFTNDALKILDVAPRDSSFKLPINNPTDPFSVFTPQPTVLQVPNPITDLIITVEYQAKPPRLFYTDYDKLVDIPDTLVPALCSYVGYRIYGNMNTEVSSAKAGEYFSIFNSLCFEAEEKNTVNTSVVPNDSKFELRGWK